MSAPTDNPTPLCACAECAAFRRTYGLPVHPADGTAEKIAVLERELEVARRDAGALRASVAELERERDALRERIAAGQAAHNEDRARADTLWRERDAARAEVQQLRAARDFGLTEVERWQKEALAQKAEVERLAHDVDMGDVRRMEEVAQARAEEREACAQVAEDCAHRNPDTCAAIAAAIRARGGAS